MQVSQPIINLAGTPFRLNVDTRQLGHFSRPEHRIPFEYFERKEPFFTAQFDTEQRIILPVEDYTGLVSDRIMKVTISAMIFEQSGTLNDQISEGLNRRSQDLDWGFYIENNDIAMRLSGVLPHIDLGGTDFTVDWRLKELRETEQPWNRIKLQDLDMSEEGDAYLCFFDTSTHQLIEPDEQLLVMPKDLVVLQIPYELRLDPIAVARDYNIGLTDLLLDHPFHTKLTALVTPVSDTGLAQYIADNIQRNNSMDVEVSRNRQPGR